MPWSSVEDFQKSPTYRRVSEMHGWTKDKLSKFVSIFNAVFERAKRNGAEDSKAEGLAYPIAFDTARKLASEETMGKLEPTIHYFAAMQKQMMARDADGTVATGREFKFNIVRKALPLVKQIASGCSVNWNHDPTHQIGAIRDIILPEDAPADVRAKADPDTPFFFAASYRSDIPAESRNELRISPEWLTLRDGEVIPQSFASTHTPLNEPELAIRRIASEYLTGEETHMATPEQFDYDESGMNYGMEPHPEGGVVVTGRHHSGRSMSHRLAAPPSDEERGMLHSGMASVLNAEHRNSLPASDFACPEDRSFPIHDKVHVKNALSRIEQEHTSKCSKESMLAKIHARAKHFGVEVAEKKAASVASPKGYERSAASTSPGAPSMPDLPELTAQVASLTGEVSKHEAARKEAEKKYADTLEVLAASDKTIKSLQSQVDALVASGLEFEAGNAADELIRAGRASTDSRPKLVDMYKRHGKASFTEIASLMPVVHPGVASSKAHAEATTLPAIADEKLASLRSGAKAMLKAGG